MFILYHCVAGITMALTHGGQVCTEENSIFVAHEGLIWLELGPSDTHVEGRNTRVHTWYTCRTLAQK